MYRVKESAKFSAELLGVSVSKKCVGDSFEIAGSNKSTDLDGCRLCFHFPSMDQSLGRLKIVFSVSTKVCRRFLRSHR